MLKLQAGLLCPGTAMAGWLQFHRKAGGEVGSSVLAQPPRPCPRSPLQPSWLHCHHHSHCTWVNINEETISPSWKTCTSTEQRLSFRNTFGCLKMVLLLTSNKVHTLQFLKKNSKIIVYKFILSSERLRLTCLRERNGLSQNLTLSTSCCLNISKRYFPSIKCTFYNRLKTNPSNNNKITVFWTILDFMQIRKD